MHLPEVIPETALASVIPEGPGGVEKGEHHQLDQFFLLGLVEPQIAAHEQDQRLVHVVKRLPSDLIAAPDTWTAIFFAGTLLFFVSDVVLILNTFGQESRFSLRVTNLSLYYVGQLLIALSLQYI